VVQGFFAARNRGYKLAVIWLHQDSVGAKRSSSGMSGNESTIISATCSLAIYTRKSRASLLRALSSTFRFVARRMATFLLAHGSVMRTIFVAATKRRLRAGFTNTPPLQRLSLDVVVCLVARRHLSGSICFIYSTPSSSRQRWSRIRYTGCCRMDCASCLCSRPPRLRLPAGRGHCLHFNVTLNPWAYAAFALVVCADIYHLESGPRVRSSQQTRHSLLAAFCRSTWLIELARSSVYVGLGSLDHEA